METFLQRLDDIHDILESASVATAIINSHTDPAITAQEFAAALNTDIVIQVLRAQIDAMRNPLQEEAEYHGE